MSDTLVVKIGGSTLGNHDTTLEDLVTLQRRGFRTVVVHGGGARISQWLALHNIPTRFERGLRVTDAASLEVVVAVLAGTVNKELVSSLSALGALAVGLSGADGTMLRGQALDENLGFAGEVTQVDLGVLAALLDAGFMPVLASVGLQWDGEKTTGQLLNVNADTAAGAVAEALKAKWLVFLTDVEGVRADGAVIPRLSVTDAARLMDSKVIEGGMIPKVEACLRVARTGALSVIADGRNEHALLSLIEGKAVGTVVG